ncbi:MAG: PD-(D/E)XK nuclease family protein [Firmicutes bacterium]|nr:PD-(D/E)XK nuclease family protein [Bacillota bacterium]
MDKSMFSFIKSYIPTKDMDPKEDFLTQLFAWMLINIDGLIFDYCRFLLEKINGSPIQIIGNETISVRTQVTVKNGRIDLVIKLNENGFICEHKIFAPSSEEQIKKYAGVSHSLGSGIFHTVLVTATKLQHIPDADVKLTWGEICELFETKINKYDDIGKFMIEQFTTYLKELGLGYTEPIKLEELLAHFPARTLEKNLDALFSEIQNLEWEKRCPSLKQLNSTNLNVNYKKYRWGRKGIDFFSPWLPGVFAGVILDAADHSIHPKNIEKGPDFVVLIETDYDPDNGEVMQRRNQILQSQAFTELKKRLELNHGEFEFISEPKENPWRVLVLKRPLFDILKGQSSKAEQIDAILNNISRAIDLFTQDDFLKKAFS